MGAGPADERGDPEGCGGEGEVEEGWGVDFWAVEVGMMRGVMCKKGEGRMDRGERLRFVSACSYGGVSIARFG